MTRYNSDKLKVKRSNRKNKKYMVEVDGTTVHFGAKGYRMFPGTKRGDNYCARSFGITDKQGNPTRNNPKSPNYWARKLWRCEGKKSKR